jgi:hypothetical protein
VRSGCRAGLVLGSWPQRDKRIDRRVLITPQPLAVLPLQGEKLHIDLHVMPGHLLLIAVSVDGATADAVWQPVESVAVERAIDGRIGDPPAVIERSRYQTMRIGPR